MDIAVLGPIQVGGDGRKLSHRDRVVLSVLVADFGRAVARDTIADALWGESVPDSAAKVVQGCIMRLRRLLGAAGIVTSAHGYALRVRPDTVDAQRFEQLISEAHQQLSADRPGRAAYLVDKALSLWRGRPFLDLEDWPPGRAEALRLEELRLDAEDVQTQAALRLGRHAEVLARAARRAAEAPLRERRWALLALAQYQGDRQSEALDTLRRAKAMLLDEQGLDPGVELTQLEAAILRHDADLWPREPPPDPEETCPYPGLLAYGMEDAAAFFGREGELTACLERLQATGVLAVVGPSGCGKSSLVRAGIAAALTRDGAKVSIITPGDTAIAASADTATRIRVSSGDVLVADQCEQGLSEEVDPAVRRLWADTLVRHSEHGRLVLALRADRVGDLAAHPTLAHLVEQGLYLLGAMEEPALRAAIEGPARQSGLHLEPGLTDLLVHEVRGEPGALPLLSHTLRQVWLRREGETLTVSAYHACGGVREALTQSADGLYERLDPDERTLLRGLMLRLVSPTSDGEPMRARVPRRYVVADPAQAALVERLVAARLVSSSDDNIEIAHEALAREWPRLRAWLDEDVEGQRILRHLSVTADSWDTMGRTDSELYRGVRLSRALEWRSAGHALSPVEVAFLDASEAAAASERDAAERQVVRERGANRRLRMLLAVAATLAVLAAASGVVASRAARQARDQAVTADARRVEAQALTAPHPDTSMLLALAGMRLDPRSDSARAGLAAALDRWPQLVRVAVIPPATAMAVDPITGHVVLSHARAGISVYDGKSLARLGSSGVGGGDTVDASQDGRMVVACDRPPGPSDPVDTQPIRVFSATGQPWPTQPGGIPAQHQCYYSVAFGANGHRLVAAVNGNPGPYAYVALWDTAHLERPLALVPCESHVTTAAVSADGRTVWTTGDYFLRALDVATGRQRAARTGTQLGLEPLAFHDESWSPPMTLSPDGATLAVVAESEVGLLDAHTLRLKARLEAPARVNRIAFSADSRRFAVADGNDVIVWDVRGGAPVHVFPAPDGNGRRPVEVFRAQTTGADLVGLSPDGTTLYAAGTDGQLLAWTLSHSSGFVTSRPSAALRNKEIMARVSPDGSHVAYLANVNNRLEVRDVATGTLGPVLDPQGTNFGTADIAWSPDGRTVIGVAGDYRVREWEPSTGTMVADHGLGQRPTAVQYTTDGSVLVGSDQGQLQVMDAKTLAVRGPPTQVLDEGITGLALDRTSHTVLVDGATEHVLVDYVTGRRLSTLPDAGSFSPDGRTLAVVDTSGGVGFRSTSDLHWVARPDPTHAYGGPISAYSHDGAWFASSRDGHVGMWDTRTGSSVGSLTVSKPVALGFSADDSQLVIGGFDGSVLTWDLRPRSWVAAACAIAGRDLTTAEWSTALPERQQLHVCPATY